ncbi:hypothetical protein LCGC14_0659980 [marine sediment metagenome]|uniref:Tetratricopeptide repeat protein n=1 Tax=marine sediment metagenome TaxID=412755 RepID=A0A0F9QYV0_9ZZZZ|nr:tetratricopeptide repeat protein [archaeon]
MRKEIKFNIKELLNKYNENCYICKNFEPKKEFCSTYDCYPFNHKTPVEEYCKEFTLDKIKEVERRKEIEQLSTWNELKWLGIEKSRFKDRIESLREYIEELSMIGVADINYNYMKKYNKKKRDEYELEIWGYNNKIARIENRINALEKDPNLAKKSNEIYMQKYKALEHREKGFLERWLASSLPGEKVFTEDYSLLNLDQQKIIKKSEMYQWDAEDLSWFDKIGKHWEKGMQHGLQVNKLKDEISFFEKENQIEKAIGKRVELLMYGYPHDGFVNYNLRSIALYYVELKKFSLALKVLDRYLTLFPDDDEVVLLKQDVQESLSLNKDFHEIREAREARLRTERDLQQKSRPNLMIISYQDDYGEFLTHRALILNSNYHSRFLSSYKEKVLSKPNITSWSNLGFAYLEKGEFDKAAHSFLKATQLRSKNQRLWIWGAEAHVEAKKYREAIDLYKQMLPIIDMKSSKIYFGSFLFHVFYLFETIFIQNPKDSKTILEIKEIYSLSRAKIEKDAELKQFITILNACEESINQSLINE